MGMLTFTSLCQGEHSESPFLFPRAGGLEVPVREPAFTASGFRAKPLESKGPGGANWSSVICRLSF